MTLLTAWAQRLDALSLRERLFVFLTVAMLMVGLADQLVMAPALRDLRERQQAQTTQATELQALRTELMALSQPASAPDGGGDRARVEALSAERLALQARLHPPITASAAGRSDLRALLDQVLKRHALVTLQSLQTRPGSADAAASAAAVTPMAGWQQAQLAVSGRYPDLQRFVAELERSLPGLRWGELGLDTQPGPPLMRLSLWVPGDRP